MGHIVYGLIVGVIYAALDKLWVSLLIAIQLIATQKGPARAPCSRWGEARWRGSSAGSCFGRRS